MPHIRKPRFTVAIPARAERLTIRGVACARWKTRTGTITGVVCAGNSARARVESRKYHCFYTDEHGQRTSKPAYSDKAASEALLAKLVQQSARIASGLLPPEAAVERATMAALLERWERHLKAEGTTKHAARQRARVAAIVAGLDVKRPADLTPGKVRLWIAAQRTERKRFGAQSAFHWIGAAKAFTRWLCLTEKYEPVDHLSGLERNLDPTDQRHVRRTLAPAEFTRLIQVTAASATTIRGLTPHERVMLYLVAASTGLRASELASLAAMAFDLDARPPVVNVAAAYAKNRRKDELYIPAELLPELKAFLAARKPKEKVWPNREKNAHRAWWSNAAKMLRIDLAAAGIPFADDAGRVFDFHALRSQFLTDLDRAGTSLARAQKLARHSTPLLTSKYYTRPDREELAAEVNKLGRSLTPALTPPILP